MNQVIIIRYGELALKGLNRAFFEDKLVKNIRQILWAEGPVKMTKYDSRIYLEVEARDAFTCQTMIEKITKVFGVVSVSLATRLPLDFALISQTATEAVAQALTREPSKTFKVVSKRINKKFPLGSLELNRTLGGIILEKFPQLTVDVHQPELTVSVELRETYSYVYAGRFPGFGGMPYGSNDKALLLLSGGIDSPVAGWLMAKRGVALAAVHFHSYPYTSERAQAKVVELAQILSGYCQKLPLYQLNLLKIQQAIKKNCPEELFTILSRRAMMMLAEKIAQLQACNALITGESLGQVASQTIPSLHATNNAVSLPVFRPLISMDKTEIMQLATKIGTYETSILPYEDCCTVFLPKRPVTKPRLEKVLLAESALDLESLISEALAEVKFSEVMPPKIR